MKSRATNPIDFAKELRSGHHYGVFIDDTGSPGLSTPGLNAERKSWVAVIIPPQQMGEVMDQLPKALTFLQELGLKDPEFHFTDIWAGKGEYQKLDLQKRLGIFAFMAHIFATYGFKVLVQTLDPENAEDVRNRAPWPDSLGPLKFSDHEDLALIFALLRVRIHLQDLSSNASACVIVDEGRLASGRVVSHPGLAPTFVAGSILFASSRLVQAIQLADFAAFVMNRSQLLRVKEKLSTLDKTFLEIVSPMAKNFVNIQSKPINGWPDIEHLR